MAPRPPPSQFLSSSLRARPRPGAQPQRQPLLRRSQARANSTLPKQPHPPPPSSSSLPQPADASTSTRVSKILSRLPKGLQNYTSALRAAPVSHVTAFLVLHELTAVVPLFALFGLFHTYVDVGPVEAWMRGHSYGGYVSQGMESFERYFRRKGWFGFEKGEGMEDGQEGVEGQGRAGGEERMGEYVTGEDGRAVEAAQARYKIVVEVALAYAITKALLPLRIVGSVWATPWCAGVLVRLRKLVRPAS